MLCATAAPALDEDWRLRDSLEAGRQNAAGLVAGHDLDRDGTNELVVFGRNRRDPNAFILKSTGEGGWETVWQGGTPGTEGSPWAVPLGAVGDSDGDGQVEILIAQYSDKPSGNKVFIHKMGDGELGPGNPPQAATATLEVGAPIVGILVDDLDGNGKPEVIVATADAERSLLIFESEGAHTWREPVVSALGTSQAGLSAITPTAADVDGDGRKEFGVLYHGGSRLAVVSWDGGSAEPRVEFTHAAHGGLRHFSRIVIGDLDGDGRDEIISSDYHNGTFYVVKATGSDQYEVDAPGGLKLNPDGVSPLAVLPASDDPPRGPGLLFGVQVTDTGEGRDLFFSEYISERKGRFVTESFSTPRRVMKLDSPPVALAVMDPDGEGPVRLAVGTRENPDGPEVLILEYTPTGERRARPLVDDSPLLAPGMVVPTDLRHLTIYAEEGRFLGWPANEGLWSWDGGRELLVGFEYANFLIHDDNHDVDRDGPKYIALARSLDAGETWEMTLPEEILPPAYLEDPEMYAGQPDREPAPCPGGYDFSHPDFAMKARGDTFYFSKDRGHSWDGPFLFPELRGTLLMARTDYVVLGPGSLIAFITSSLTDGTEGRSYAIRTDDGGATWYSLGWMAPEPPRAQPGLPAFSIMPATVQLSERSFVSALRQRIGRRQWVDVYRSDDGGEFWEYVSTPIDGVNSPADMVRLDDGRLCIVYGWRQYPFGMRARMSEDEGRTWGPQIILRQDGRNWDIGYPRLTQLPDGRLLAVYYYSTPEEPQQYIAGTIFDPNSLKEMDQ